jgi:hypothetical protein
VFRAVVLALIAAPLWANVTLGVGLVGFLAGLGIRFGGKEERDTGFRIGGV